MKISWGFAGQIRSFRSSCFKTHSVYSYVIQCINEKDKLSANSPQQDSKFPIKSCSIIKCLHLKRKLLGVGKKYLKLSFLILNAVTCLSKTAIRPCLRTEFSSFTSSSDSERVCFEFRFSFFPSLNKNNAVFIICLCLTILSTPFLGSFYDRHDILKYTC